MMFIKNGAYHTAGPLSTSIIGEENMPFLRLIWISATCTGYHFGHMAYYHHCGCRTEYHLHEGQDPTGELELARRTGQGQLIKLQLDPFNNSIINKCLCFILVHLILILFYKYLKSSEILWLNHHMFEAILYNYWHRSYIYIYFNNCVPSYHMVPGINIDDLSSLWTLSLSLSYVNNMYICHI